MYGHVHMTAYTLEFSPTNLLTPINLLVLYVLVPIKGHSTRPCVPKDTVPFVAFPKKHVQQFGNTVHFPRTRCGVKPTSATYELSDAIRGLLY